MSTNETIMANKLRRSKTLSLLLVILFTLSTISLPACSDNDNNTVSQRAVQAIVFFDDEGPAAVAWVWDGAKNFVSDASLSINDRAFEITEASDEDSVPVYHLKLYDLTGGDSLTFVANRSDGTLIYAPPIAQIPMPISLIEPVPDQSINPGEELVVRWAGGEGGTHIAALYADNQGAEEYMDIQKYAGVTQITVPAGVIREGLGIIGAAALVGDIPTVQSGTSGLTDESSFVAYRVAEASIDVKPATDVGLGGVKWHEGCPKEKGWGPERANQFCSVKSGKYVAIMREIIWRIHWKQDEAHYPPCPATCGLNYCKGYLTLYGVHWQENCLCPR